MQATLPNLLILKMKVPFVDLKAQYRSIKNDIDLAIAGCIENTSFIGGSKVTEFEDAFAAFIGSAYCIGCANGTDAIELALQAAGVGAGDEVIVPAYSWISTSEAVTTVGATPVFVEVHPDYYTIDTFLIKEKITQRTKAIIPVHFYGLPAKMDDIMVIANQYDLIVIEDCAQAHGASYNGQKVGTFGQLATFSFYPGKNLGAYGDAGAVVTNDQQLARKVRMIGNHGQAGKHNHEMEGRNSRIDAMQAAILSAKLPYLEKWTNARIANAALYSSKLVNSNVKIPIVPEAAKHVYHLYVVQVDNRDEVMDHLKKNGVEVALHYPTPLPMLRAYLRFSFAEQDFPVSTDMSKRLLSIPMYPELTETQISYVVDLLVEALS